jgi:hypothetical protein
MRENELSRALEQISQAGSTRLSEHFEQRVWTAIARRQGAESWPLAALLSAALQPTWAAAALTWAIFIGITGGVVLSQGYRIEGPQLSIFSARSTGLFPSTLFR